MGVNEIEPNQINTKASTVALEWVKQIITLSSGIIALSATFIEKIGCFPSWVLIFLILSWICFITSVITGLNTISAIVQSNLLNNNKWSEGVGKRNASACKWLFICGVGIFCTFSILAIVI